MLLVNHIDIIEQDIANSSYALLDILLYDRTTGRNIIWASEDYAHLGRSYYPMEQILPELIIDSNTMLIQPRNAKAQNNQFQRTRDKAEVFTPSWVCNTQNNLVDEAWFGQRNVFNTPAGISWETAPEKIIFPERADRTWQKYIDANRMEISCGEAPYLVSRYDAATGNIIALKNRIGLLDRKLRIVNENINNESEWMKWTVRAFQSIYAYEFQGDNLLLARENLLFTFVDNIRYKLHRDPTIRELKNIATIISWNLWQMDGMTYTIPYGHEKIFPEQLSLFDMDYVDNHNSLMDEVFSKPCQIKDWRAKVIHEYKSLVMGVRL